MDNKQKPEIDYPFTRQRIVTSIKHYPKQVVLAKFDDTDGMRQLGYLRHQAVDTPRIFRRKNAMRRVFSICTWLFYFTLSLIVVGVCWYALFMHKQEEPVFRVLFIILGFVYTLTALKIQGWLRWMLLNFKHGS